MGARVEECHLTEIIHRAVIRIEGEENEDQVRRLKEIRRIAEEALEVQDGLKARTPPVKKSRLSALLTRKR